MKGVVLAGGLGKRMMPLTKVTNKHLLPVYDKPMIYYPIRILLEGGIDEILIVTGGSYAGDFLRLLGNGKDLGIRRLHYTYQEGEGGIAEALSLAEDFAEGDKICVVLGDNVIEKTIRPGVDKFRTMEEGALIYLKEVDDPQRFGVPHIEGDRIARIDEKPEKPASSYAVIGIYMYDPRVFEIIRPLTPSARGELEITDVNNAYIGKGRLSYEILDGWWTDAGTFDSLLRASKLIAEQGQG